MVVDAKLAVTDVLHKYQCNGMNKLYHRTKSISQLVWPETAIKVPSVWAEYGYIIKLVTKAQLYGVIARVLNDLLEIYSWDKSSPIYFA